jgi:CubicO group peptidase (beta-lactamase class C family)
MAFRLDCNKITGDSWRLPNMNSVCLTQSRYFALAALICWQAAWSCCYGQVALKDQVEQHVSPYLENEIVQGLAVGVLKQGQSEIWGFGNTSIHGTKTPGSDTVYEIGSISKVFTGILLADAVARGQAELTTRLAQWIPSDVPQPHESQAEITLLNLSTHTSGLPRLPSNMRSADPENPYADYSSDKLYEFLNKRRLRRQPGEKHEYSNLAVGLLGQLLADHAKTTYESLLRERLTEPLHMSETVVQLSPEQHARLAQPLDASGRPVKNWDFRALAGAGAIRSTITDMLKFAEANLRPPAGDVGRAIELAFQEHQPAIAESDLAMGLGWMIARDGHTRFHNGQTAGYHATLYVSRKLDLAVVALCNTATMELDRLTGDIFKVAAGAEISPRQFEQSVEVPLEVMQRYEGKYQMLPGQDFTVTVVDGKLMVGLTGQPTLQVYARSQTQWYYRVVQASITFKVDDSGRCDELELFQNGGRVAAKQLPESAGGNQAR